MFKRGSDFKEFEKKIWSASPKMYPMEGMKVVFIEDENDKENADGKKGQLEAVGESRKSKRI